MGIRLGSIGTHTNADFAEKDYTLTEMANKAVPTGAITINVKKIGANALRDRTSLTSVTGLNVTTIEGGAFFGCTNLTELNLPNVTSFGDGGLATSTFHGCSKIETINLPIAITYNNNASNSFSNCTKLKYFNAPLIRRVGTYSFQNDTSLQFLVLSGLELMSGGICQTTGLEGAEFERLSAFPVDTFKGSSNLSILVLRKGSVIALNNINAFTNTPFASNGSGGTLYVPESLISSYQNATNWSVILGYANNQIKKIEGTTYETHHVNGVLLPTYTEVSFTRNDAYAYYTDGTWGKNVQYISSDPNAFINKDGCNEWEFVSNATFNNNFMTAQEFNNNEFVGMATSYAWTDKVINGETLHVWKMLFPNNGNKFRFCAYPKNTIDAKPYYLYKVIRHNS